MSENLTPEEPTTQEPELNAEPLSSEAKTFVMLAHGLGIFFPILAPLLIWLLKKGDLPSIEPECKDTLNFQITWFGIGILLNATCFGAVIGIPMMLIADVFLIIATISVSNGKRYKFPWQLNLVK